MLYSRCKNKIKIAKAFISAKAFKKHLPIFVSMSLTHRCNLRCAYCVVNQKDSRELSTSEVFSIVRGLAEMGTRMISLGGGEPLMRDDIGAIISYIKQFGITVRMLSSGIMLPKRISEVRILDELRISLEGDEEAHERLRGFGTFRKTLHAIELARREGIDVNIAVGLTAQNTSMPKFLMELARRLNIGIYVHPLHSLDYFSVKERKELLPSNHCYSKSIREILYFKRKYPRIIKTSIASLKYYLSWPKPPENIQCAAGKILCRINSKGIMYPCMLMEKKYDGMSCLESGVNRAFEAMSKNREFISHCGGCWCNGTLELNHLYSMKLDAWRNLLNL